MDFLVRDLVVNELIRGKNPMPLIRYAGIMTALAGPAGIPIVGEFFGPDIQASLPSLGRLIGVDLAARTTLPVPSDIKRGQLPVAPIVQRVWTIGKYLFFPEGSPERESALRELTRNMWTALPGIPGGIQAQRTHRWIELIGDDFKKMSTDKKFVNRMSSPGAAVRGFFGFQEFSESLSRRYVENLADAVASEDTKGAVDALGKISLLGIDRATVKFAIDRGKKRRRAIRRRTQ